MEKYALCGKFTCAPEDRGMLLDILSDAAKLMENAPGCRLYIVYEEPEDDTAVWVTELWESKEAHDGSLTLPGVRELITQAMPLIKGNEGHTLTPVSGVGLFQ